jgi:peroxiredoxin
MRKHFAYVLLIALSVAFAANTSTLRAAAGGTESVNIGEKVPEFKAVDLGGREQTLSSVKGTNGTVLIFISVQCPISNAYNERMKKLAQDYAAKGINVVGINANSTEAVGAVKKHAAEHGFTFTILKDEGNKIADQLGAQHTPEAYLLDASGKLVYHGRIDNQKNVGMVSSNDLRDAIDATLAGKPVVKTTALAFGCSIKRVQ